MVLVVLPAEWAEVGSDGQPRPTKELRELGRELEQLHAEISVSLTVKGSRHERESQIPLRCYVGSRGNVLRVASREARFPWEVERYRWLADDISGLTRSFHQRVIDPAD